LADAADLLAAPDGAPDDGSDSRQLQVLPRGADARKLPADPDGLLLVLRLSEFAQLRGAQHRYLPDGGATRGLCLLALPLHWRQAHVLLAAVQSDGAASGLPAAVLQPLFHHRAVRHADR